MTNPGSANDFAKKSKKMKFPAQMDNVDYGKKTKAVPRTVDLVDSKTGKFYGTKTIMTKETTLPTFQEFLQLNEADKDDITSLPERVVAELKSLIGKGAKDLAQAWKNALELVNTAYHVSSVRLPRPDQKGAWRQYDELIKHAVKQLAASRAINGNWRVTDSLIRESVKEEKPRDIGKRRFFVHIPGVQHPQEADADSMDDVIDKITARIHTGKEVRGTKVRVASRDEHNAELHVYLDGGLRERIRIQEIS